MDLFIFGWLALGLRVAAGVHPLQNAAILAAATIGTLVTSVVLITVLAHLPDPGRPSLPLVAAIVVLLTGLIFLPLALATAGVAALFAGLWPASQSKNGHTPTPDDPAQEIPRQRGMQRHGGGVASLSKLPSIRARLCLHPQP